MLHFYKRKYVCLLAVFGIRLCSHVQWRKCAVALFVAVVSMLRNATPSSTITQNCKQNPKIAAALVVLHKNHLYSKPTCYLIKTGR